MTMEFLNPPGWPRPRGYANGIIADGRMIFLAGQVGWTSDGEFETDDFAGQVDQALRNIIQLLQEAGSTPDKIVRMTCFITDKQEYQDRLQDIGRAYRKHIGRHFPVMSVVEVSALMEDAAKVEIEVTAVT